MQKGGFELKLNVCLSGASGHVGQELVKGILKTTDIELVACLGFTTSGKRLGDVLPFPCPDLPIHRSVENALERQTVDVLIDYTTPQAVLTTVTDAIANGVHCVIGTSGLTDENYAELDRLALANNVGVFAAGNFSITAALMVHFSQIAAKFVPHWEVFDYGPDTKSDAPSGTARELAYLLGQVGQPEYAVPPRDVQGDPQSRGARLNGTQVHSVRLPGFYSAAEAIFGLPGERVSIRHDSMSYAPYVEGTLMAARKVGSMKGLVRGMGTLMGLDQG
jgi:4-hydroxy-tetrahydrodipicolinate reductase